MKLTLALVPSRLSTKYPNRSPYVGPNREAKNAPLEWDFTETTTSCPFLESRLDFPSGVEPGGTYRGKEEDRVISYRSGRRGGDEVGQL